MIPRRTWNMPGEWGDGSALDTNTSLLLSDSLENISRSGYFEIQVPIVLLGLFEAPWPVQCSGSPPLSWWVVTLISVNTGCTDLTYNYIIWLDTATNLQLFYSMQMASSPDVSCLNQTFKHRNRAWILKVGAQDQDHAAVCRCRWRAGLVSVRMIKIRTMIERGDVGYRQ